MAATARLLTRAISWAMVRLIGVVALAVWAPAAGASSTQQSIIQDNTQLQSNLTGTLQTIRELGATTVQVVVQWKGMAPDYWSFRRPDGFDGADPAAYPEGSWSFLDGVVREAQLDGLQVAFQLTGPGPRWAIGAGMPHTPNCPCGQWRPKPGDFARFAQAVGTRYDGSYVPAGETSPLPRVASWSIWNEPNYGPNLAPQARDHDRIELSPAEYRSLLNAAWRGLAAAGHTTSAGDTILFGDTAPRGLNHPIGNFSGIKPLRFLRVLYCVDSRFHRLRGRAARLRGCPSTARGSRTFRARNPALFTATGYADHPYAQGVPPTLPTYACGRNVCANRRTRRSDPQYADFAELGRLARTLDRLVSAYGSHRHLPIWNTEFGYWTNPPDHARGSLPPAQAARYMNWAEYLSYRSRRIASYAQYLLVDPSNGAFSDGLELAGDRPLPAFDAFQMPLWMPVTSVRSPRWLTVWGAARPAAYALTPIAPALIQFRPRGSHTWSLLRAVLISNPRGYFDVKAYFRRSGTVRVAWTPAAGESEYSRTQSVTVRPRDHVARRRR